MLLNRTCHILIGLCRNSYSPVWITRRITLFPFLFYCTIDCFLWHQVILKCMREAQSFHLRQPSDFSGCPRPSPCPRCLAAAELVWGEQEEQGMLEKSSAAAEH